MPAEGIINRSPIQSDISLPDAAGRTVALATIQQTTGLQTTFEMVFKRNRGEPLNLMRRSAHRFLERPRQTSAENLSHQLVRVVAHP